MKIAVDFDGTIVENCWPKIGKEVPHAVEIMKKWVKQGHDLYLWTCRCDGGMTGGGDTSAHLAAARMWCKKKGLKFVGYNEDPEMEKKYPGIAKKIWCDYYIDDKAIGVPLVKYADIDTRVVDWLQVDAMMQLIFKRSE